MVFWRMQWWDLGLRIMERWICRFFLFFFGKSDMFAHRPSPSCIIQRFVGSIFTVARDLTTQKMRSTRRPLRRHSRAPDPAMQASLSEATEVEPEHAYSLRISTCRPKTHHDGVTAVQPASPRGPGTLGGGGSALLYSVQARSATRVLFSFFSLTSCDPLTPYLVGLRLSLPRMRWGGERRLMG